MKRVMGISSNPCQNFVILTSLILFILKNRVYIFRL